MEECDHDWEIIEKREEWDDRVWNAEKEKYEASAHYIVVKARECKNCGKYEILDGNVNVKGGGEYMLEADGSWGFGISV